VKQAVNGDYLRKEALTLLSSHQYKAEVMGGNLLGYLLKGRALSFFWGVTVTYTTLSEYEKVHDALSHIPNGDVETLWKRSTTALPSMFLNLCNDGPVVSFCNFIRSRPDALSALYRAVGSHESKSGICCSASYAGTNCHTSSIHVFFR
jgi:hypothetical protein